MKTIILAVGFLILLSSCKFRSEEVSYKEVSSSAQITKLISNRVIFDAKAIEKISWSYHPFIRNCFYNKEKEVYLYRRDSVILLVDHKNNVVHDFTLAESKEIISSISGFEDVMHEIQLGQVKENISK
jgi:hypothetical protein